MTDQQPSKKRNDPIITTLIICLLALASLAAAAGLGGVIRGPADEACAKGHTDQCHVDGPGPEIFFGLL